MVSRHDGNKKFGTRPNIMTLGPKNTVFLAQKSVFFLRYAHITHFFGFRQTRLNGIISCPYPQVTLYAFGFPLCVRSAGRFLAPMDQNGPLAENAIFYAMPI